MIDNHTTWRYCKGVQHEGPYKVVAGMRIVEFKEFNSAAITHLLWNCYHVLNMMYYPESKMYCKECPLPSNDPIDLYGARGIPY